MRHAATAVAHTEFRPAPGTAPGRHRSTGEAAEPRRHALDAPTVVIDAVPGLRNNAFDRHDSLCTNTDGRGAAAAARSWWARRTPEGQVRVVAATVLAAIAGAVAIASVPQGGTAPSTTSAAPVDGQYLGTSALGCSVHAEVIGDVHASLTDPVCTRAKLAQRMCDLDVSDDEPTVAGAGTYAVTQWQVGGGYASFIDDGTVRGQFTATARCYSPTAGAHEAVFLGDEWNEFNGVRSTLSPTVEGKIENA